MRITRRSFIKQTTLIIAGGFMATPHFTDKELMCGCGCLDCYMQLDFMESLERKKYLQPAQMDPTQIMGMEAKRAIF